MKGIIQKRYTGNLADFHGEVNDDMSVVDVSGYLPTDKLLRSYMLAGKNLVDYRTRIREGLVTSNVSDDIDPRDYREPVGRGADLTDVSVALKRVASLAEEALKDVPPLSPEPPKEDVNRGIGSTR